MINIDLMEYSSDALAQAAYVSNFSYSDVDSTTGGTATASHNYGSYVPARAIDNNDATEFAQGGGYGTVGAYWQVQLLAAAAIQKLQIKVKSGERAAGMKVQACNDGASWVDITGSLTIAATNNYQYFTWANTTAYIYWRLTITVVGPTTDNVIYEVQLLTAGLLCYAESTIKLQGSYSLKIDAGTNTLNKTLTRTIAAPLDLQYYKAIIFNVYASRIGSNFTIGFHDSGGTTTTHTINILAANTWQKEYVNLVNLLNTSKDAIDQIIITITNADSANIIYIDNMIADMFPHYLPFRGRARHTSIPYSGV